MRRSESNWNAAFMRQNGALEGICLAPQAFVATFVENGRSDKGWDQGFF
jgi:hypothetical protein